MILESELSRKQCYVAMSKGLVNLHTSHNYEELIEIPKPVPWFLTKEDFSGDEL